MRQSIDAHHLAPARAAGGQPHLPARLVGRLEHHDLVAARGGDPRRLQPAGPAPTTTNLRAPSRGAISCGIVSSRPVAGLWMQ